MSAIILDGDIVHYEVLGRGRPLFYLHGWVGSWRYWIPAMQVTSTSYRSYALDLYGFGDTAKKSDKYGLEFQLRLLSDFMSEMGIGKVGLVGHGLGAIVALLFAKKFPDQVDRIMVISLPVAEGGIHQRLRTSPPAELAEWLLSRETVSEAARSETAKIDAEALSRSFTDIDGLDLARESMQLTTPCLLVYGDQDPVVTTPEPAKLADFSELTHQISFPESGHFPMLDEANKFNRLLMDFLALDSGDSPRKLQLKEEWKRRVR